VIGEAVLAPRPFQLLTMAVRTAREEPARVFLPALGVFAIDATAATAFTELSADHLGLESVAAAAILATSTLGLTFYSGLLEQLVGAVERGLEAPPVLRVLRTLPYGRLLVADAILWVLTSVASTAFVVPGLVVTTLGVLIGPVITMQGSTVTAAFRTSVRVVSPHFLLVLCMVTLPLLVENDAVTAIKVLIPHENVWLVFGSHLAMGLTFGVTLGLVEVSLAEAFLHGARGPAHHVRSASPAAEAATEGGHGHHARDDSWNDDAGAGGDAGAG
jgi:hypothetical protein